MKDWTPLETALGIANRAYDLADRQLPCETPTANGGTPVRCPCQNCVRYRDLSENTTRMLERCLKLERDPAEEGRE